MKLLLVLLMLQPSGKMVSKYLSWAEATHTNQHIANIPDDRQKANIVRFGLECFDPLRIKAKSPLRVHSLFRSEAVNRAVGGAKNSDHMIKDDVVACDIGQEPQDRIHNRALFFLIKDNIPFYKTIWEFGTLPVSGAGNATTSGSPQWVHLSWSLDPKKNEMRKLYVAIKKGNKTIYKNFAIAVTKI